MDGRVDETEHVISSCKFENTPANKKYKEQKLSEIIIAICAMLNSNGGNVLLRNECDCKKFKKYKSSQMSLVVRMLEQSMISILGLIQTGSNINFKVDAERTLILVKKSEDCLITTNYNLCLPSQSQVVQVSSCEPLENVKRNIINRKVIEEPVQLGSHYTVFIKDKHSGIQESKLVQLKLLKAGPSKRTTLADRMTGKGNKFSCYVSAFANYNGGHIYYGIRDNGVVKGESIPNEQDKNEITKKVGKVVNKMIWPEQIGQPKRGVHWEIFFEPVVHENSKSIPSTFVIVIHIAACVGGVFTEEPECYEMVEGKVEKMSFTTWKKAILHQHCHEAVWELYLEKKVYLKTSMDGRVDETVHVIYPCKFENTLGNKRYKEQKLSEIIIAICAMLNSNGGNVVLYNECDCEKCKSSQMSLVVRILEQSIISILGSCQTVSNINFKVDAERTLILIKKSDCLITTNYNLCLPSQSQVVQVSSCEPLENVKRNIINRKVVEEPIQLDSHYTVFIKDKHSGIQESKLVQLKLLKAGPSKRTTLADRMTGKGNKFSCYVSAFANYDGGHIYYGIRDNGVVEGESIPNEQDKNEITKKVGKVVNKMIWPEKIGKPKRGAHWEISFEPVVDKNSKPIPSTFVIVIYIAACVGGLFTEEPECYEMVKGKVKMMSFATWKERISAPVESVPSAISNSITWLSKKIRNRCIEVFCVLTLCLNNADLEGYEMSKKYFVEKYPDIVELELVVLLKEILAHARKHNFKKADDMLEKYKKLLPSAAEHRIFEVLGHYVEAACNRPKEVEKEAEREASTRIRDLLVSAMAKSHWLIPGLVTAVVQLFAGTMTDRFDDAFLYHFKPDVLSRKALQHLQDMPDNPEVRADLKNKAHITLATYYLGCNISGELVAEHVNDNDLKEANSSVMAINKDKDKRKLAHYREVQLNLVKSIYSFRCSENQPEERMQFMHEAFEYSKNSEKFARKWKFYEMVRWSKSLQSLYVEKLLRVKLAQNRMYVHKSSAV